MLWRKPWQYHLDHKHPVNPYNHRQVQGNVSDYFVSPRQNYEQLQKAQPRKYGTVDSRYLELGYLEFCETQSAYLNQKYILIAFWSWRPFLQVQITRSAN